jgi:hypothetical protein
MFESGGSVDMAEKKATTTAPVKKAAVKAPVKKATAKKVSRNGQSLVCGVCGLSVTIDEDCGCIETHEILCCGEPMKERKARAKPAAKAKAA